MFRRTIAATLTASAALALTLTPTAAHADSASGSWTTQTRGGPAHFNASATYGGTTPVLVSRVRYSVPGDWDSISRACVTVTFRKWNGAEVSGIAKHCLTENNVSRVLDLPPAVIPGRRGRVRFVVNYDDGGRGGYGAVYVLRLT